MKKSAGSIENISKNENVKEEFLLSSSCLSYESGKTELLKEGLIINMKDYVKLTGKAFLLVIAGSVIGLVLLILAFMIPTERINANVKASAKIFEREGSYPQFTTLGATNLLDNFTDALMLLNAAYDNGAGVIDRVINVYRPTITDKDPAQVIVAYYNGEEPTSIASYSRYWHGYLIFLKPLLFLFKYDQIRILNTFLMSALTTISIILLYMKGMKRYILPYILSLLLIDPLVISQSLQYSSVYYIFTLALIIFLYKKDWFETKSERIVLFFVLIGCATSYFDLLTYPFVTFGVPAVLYLCDSGKPFKENAKTMLMLLIAWGIGYVGLWAGKWILGTILGNRNVISDALSTIATRSSMADISGNEFTLFTLLKEQLKQFKTPIFGVAMLYVLISGLYILFHHPIKKLHNPEWIIYTAICFLPVVWYIGASNHSYIHYWMTYRELMISAYSGMCMLAKYATKTNAVDDEELTIEKGV